MSINKGFLEQKFPVDVTFAAELANKAHTFIDHHPVPTNNQDTVFMDVPPGQSPTSTNTLRNDSRRFFLDYLVAAGDKGVLTVTQNGVVKATAAIPDGDSTWVFGVI